MHKLFEFTYKSLFKPIAFSFDPEQVHEHMTAVGETLGRSRILRRAINYYFTHPYPQLRQHLAGIDFSTPIGLAAGFDYQAQLTQILPDLGFGFQSVGTITNHAYAGNPGPRLGRLPKSKSLMVNKGFKNAGARVVAKKLQNMEFRIPVGISIGRSNRPQTFAEAINDIMQSFIIFEGSHVNNSYYELNISCPNLAGDISFYNPENLSTLLHAIDELDLHHPLFIKMPIEKTDQETLSMLEVIARHSPAGVIFGNLQKNRSDPALEATEIVMFDRGSFSGKPTERRSNELIALTYKTFGERLIIVGCGGVFSAEDAYQKIKLGASLVQLITGMIFEGPQLISQINQDLSQLLQKDGFDSISKAIGSKIRV